EDEVRYLDEYNQLTLARLRLAEGSFTGVSDLLERLLALAEAQKRTGNVIEILLTQALVHQAQADHPKALAALEHALALAQPECYLRTFVDEGEPMRLLILDFKTTIEKQGRPNVHHLFGYANKLLAAFPDSMQAIPQSRTLAPHAQLPRMQVPGSAGVTNPNSKVIEPLTDRELEILHLIAEGHSNAEIGKRLYLALSTVKGHNLRIFNKLQVQNRTEAVARARELRLL
ncbi:MAG: LuxR C-terminal-related transcriptional regulator, partial [Bacteroidota bacterium]